MGEAMALIIKRKRNTRRTGVMNLPTRATSLDGEIASHQVMIKTPRQNIKPHAPHFRRQVLRHSNLISHRRRTGSRKKRSDGQVQRRAEENAVRQMNTPRQFTEIHTGVANGKNTQKRKTYACDQKPIVAGIVFTPAFCPMKTGNIKFPAPKIMRTA